MSYLEPQADDTDEHSDIYVRWSTKSAEPFDRDKLKLALDSLPNGILRLKGVASTLNRDNAYVVQCVGKRGTLQAIDAPASRQSGLVAIGLCGEANLQELEDLFNSCRHEG